MIRNKLEHETCKKIAADLGTSLEEVIIVVRSQMRFVKWVMERSGFETVMVPYLGKFKVRARRAQAINNLNNRLK